MVVLRPLLRRIIIKWILIPPHLLTNFEIQKYYKNEPRFNDVYSRYNLPERSSNEIKDGTYGINLDEYSHIGTHWVALYLQNNNNVIYFDSFDVEHIHKEIRAFVINVDNNKNIITNMFRIQAHDSIMCRYFLLILLILCLQEKL